MEIKFKKVPGTENSENVKVLGANEEIVLSGEYDGSEYVESLPRKELAALIAEAPVPNSGTVEKIYFNTSLSVEEVDAILATLEYTDVDFVYNIICDKDLSDIYQVFNVGDGYVIYHGSQYIVYCSSESYKESHPSIISFTGWNPDFEGEDVANIECNSTDGLQNDKLVDLVSTNPFVIELSINIRDMITDGKIPLDFIILIK